MIKKYRTNHLLWLVSLFFGLILVLCFPYSFEKQFQVEISITATGQPHPNGKSAEVWVNYPLADAFQWDTNLSQYPDGWEEKDGRMVSYRNQPSTFKGVLRFTESDSLRLAQHPYSGEAIVKIGDDLPRRIDLYSPSLSEFSIPLAPYAKHPLSLIATLGGFLFWYAAATVAIHIAGRAFLRFAPNDPERDARQALPKYPSLSVLQYAAPALAVFIFLHAVVWPGQLSPDSIDMFEQVTRGGAVSDAHSAVLIYFLKGIYSIFPHVAALIFAQYALFALALGGVLYEMRMRLIRQSLLLFLSFVVALYPGVFLIATTLWKDVPYTALLLGLAWWGLSAVRHEWKLSTARWCLLTILFVLIATVRHNGISVVVFFGFMAIIYLRRISIRTGLGILGISLLTLAALFSIKPLIMERIGVVPIGKHYKTMHAVHFAGAVIANGAAEKDLVRPFLDIMAEREWTENYKCSTVVPLFWHPKLLSYPLGERVDELNRAAVRLAMQSPNILIAHQLCVTSLLWRITPRTDDYVAISPMGITSLPQTAHLGLNQESLLPELNKRLGTLTERHVTNSVFLGRPAFLIFVSLLLCVFHWIKYRDTSSSILATVVLGNMAGLALLMSAQDYRYQFPAVVIAILLCFWCLFIGKTQTRPGVG